MVRRCLPFYCRARIGVTGNLAIQTWVDRDGVDRKTPKIQVKSIEILETKAEANLREKKENRGPPENGFWGEGGGGAGGWEQGKSGGEDFFE